jgi:hypothetical protein
VRTDSANSVCVCRSTWKLAGTARPVVSTTKEHRVGRHRHTELARRVGPGARKAARTPARVPCALPVSTPCITSGCTRYTRCRDVHRTHSTP